MAKNQYLKRLQDERRVAQKATGDTFYQFAVDCMCIALNLEFGFGKERLVRVLTKFDEVSGVYDHSLTDDPDSDYCREKLEAKIQELFGDMAASWESRYPWLKKM